MLKRKKSSGMLISKGYYLWLSPYMEPLTSEGRSDELGRNYLSWDTWKKIVVKKYLFFAKLQPVEVGGEAKIHWFWLILVYFYQRNYKRKSTTPTSTPSIFELESRIFFWSKVLIYILSFMHQEGCQSSQKRTGGGNFQWPPPSGQYFSIHVHIIHTCI